MAKKSEGHIVRTYRTVARSELGLIVPPLVLIPAILWALLFVRQKLIEGGDDATFLDWRWFVIPVAFLLLFPLWAKFKTRFFSRYRVTLDSVIEEHGFFGKTSSEIRIQDIRNIVVKQSFLDRLLAMGSVHFSSAAGDAVEVKFRKIARPGKAKELVRDIQGKLSDGRLTDSEVADIVDRAADRRKKANAPKASSPATKDSPKASSSDDDPPPPERNPPKRDASKTDAPKALPPSNESKAESTTDDDAGEGDDDDAALPDWEDDGEESATDDASRDELYRLLAQQEAEGKTDE